MGGKKEKFGFKFLNPFKETCVGRALISLQSSVRQIVLSAWKNIGCRTVTKKDACKEQAPCLPQKADGAEDGTKHLWYLDCYCPGVLYCLLCESGPGLIRDEDYCRGVAQVTLAVQSMQVYLCGLVQTFSKRAMWEGWASSCEVMGSRMELSSCFFFCGFTALMTTSKPSGKEPEAN